jgi:hypothetical protein
MSPGADSIAELAEAMVVATKSEKSTAIRVNGPLPAARHPRDTDWPERIEKAKEARAAAREARKGKPATFATRQVPQWTSR